MATAITLPTLDEATDAYETDVTDRVLAHFARFAATLTAIAGDESGKYPDEVKVQLFQLLADIAPALAGCTSSQDVETLRALLSQTASPEQAEIIRQLGDLRPGQRAALIDTLDGLKTGQFYVRPDGAILPPRQPGIGSGSSGSSTPPSGGAGSSGTAPATPASSGTPSTTTATTPAPAAPAPGGTTSTTSTAPTSSTPPSGGAGSGSTAPAAPASGGTPAPSAPRRFGSGRRGSRS